MASPGVSKSRLATRRRSSNERSRRHPRSGVPPMRTLPGPRQRVVTLIVTLGLICHASALALPAQESRVAAGTRVRFELRSGERYDGRVISLGRDTLEAGFPPNGAAARYPLGDISKLEIVSG